MISRQLRQATPFGFRSNSHDVRRIGIILKECSMRTITKHVEAIEAEAIATKAQPSLESKDNEARNQAAHRVYERYGTNLAAFRRDVEREVTAQNEASQENERR